MGQRAGELDLPLETGDGGVGHLVHVQQLHGRRPAEHGVPGLVDRPHAAGPEFLLQRVLAELLGRQGRLLQRPLLPGDEQHGQEDAGRAEDEQRHQDPERAAQDVRRAGTPRPTSTSVATPKS